MKASRKLSTSERKQAFTFDEDAHIYRLFDGTVVPGHTRVLDLGGIVPYTYIEEDILERKSDIGRQTHTATLYYDQGKKFVVDPRIEGRVRAWETFIEQTGYRSILREYRQVCTFNNLTFGMQIDSLGRFPADKNDTVAEIKTCAMILPHHGVQLAAQAAGVDFFSPGAIQLESHRARFCTRNRIVVQLFEDGRWKVHRFTDRSDLELFEHALAITYWKMAHEKTYREVRSARNGNV